MAFRLTDARFQLTDFFHKRGRIMADAEGNLSVECKKHPYGWITAKVISAFDVGSSIAVAEVVNEAFANCSWCIDERLWTASRFPEGAEL